MTQPTSDTAVSRPDLAVVVDEFRESEMTAAIGDRVMPYFPVAEQSAEFPVIPKEVMLKAPDTKRAMRGGYPSSDWEFEMGRYATQENGWEEKIDDRERKLYARLFDAEVVATRRAERIIQMAREKRIATKVFNASNFTPNAVTHEWDDADNATPIANVNTGKLAVRFCMRHASQHADHRLFDVPQSEELRGHRRPASLYLSRYGHQPHDQPATGSHF